MILTPIGGVRLPTRTQPLQKQARLQAKGTRVYLRLPEKGEYTLPVSPGDGVKAGSLLASASDGVPIYSSVSGVFDGVFSNNGGKYAGVTDDGAAETTEVRAPETRPIEELSPDDLLEATRVLGITDIKRGEALYRTAKAAFGNVKRIVIDTTDPSGYSFTNAVVSTQSPTDLLGGAKLFARMLGCAKVILLVDEDRPQVLKTLTEAAAGNPLFAVAKTVVCYPMTDEMIYEMLYYRRISYGKTLTDAGVFMTDAQTAVQFYSAMLTGVPQTSRWLTAGGEGFGQEAVLQMPLGTPWQNILTACKFKGDPYITMVNSPLNGVPAKGVCEGNAVCVASEIPTAPEPMPCNACGHCAMVCPVWLQPMKILQKDQKAIEKLAKYCIGCAACEYICPSELPLAEMIATAREEGEHNA